MSTFVLVHGAFAGGWYWRWVTPYLRTAGFEVVVPTMTGLGERAHLASPDVDLETHIKDVLQVYAFEDLRDTILVGHSYGGMIVAAVADRMPERVRHLVYFDSDAPRDGETSVPPKRHAARIERARTEGDGWRVRRRRDSSKRKSRRRRRQPGAGCSIVWRCTRCRPGSTRFD
jgi:pimeloyl-ACP methyl ester carboxylesterase